MQRSTSVTRLWILLPILAVLLCACVPPPPVPAAASTPTPTPPSTPPPTSTPAAPSQDWTYYTNQEMGFSIHLPDGWKVQVHERETGNSLRAVSFGAIEPTDDATIVTVVATPLVDAGYEGILTPSQLWEIADKLAKETGLHQVEPTAESNVAGYPAIIVAYESAASDSSYTLRSYLAVLSTPQWLYQILAAGVAGHSETVASIHRAVLDSFSSPPEVSVPTPTSTPYPKAITKACLNLREGPGINFKKLRDECFEKGTSVTLLGRAIAQQPWAQVVTENAETGWMSADPRWLDYGIQLDSLPAAFYRPLSGVVQEAIQLTGKGTFEVTNSGSEDCVVVLARNGRADVAIYVRGGEQFTVQGIPDGTYEVYDAAGSDWDGSMFHTIAARGRFVEPFPFETTPAKADIWKVTIQAVQGNVEGEDVTAADFPAILSDIKGE